MSVSSSCLTIFYFQMQKLIEVVLQFEDLISNFLCIKTSECFSFGTFEREINQNLSCGLHVDSDYISLQLVQAGVHMILSHSVLWCPIAFKNILQFTPSIATIHRVIIIYYYYYYYFGKHHISILQAPSIETSISLILVSFTLCVYTRTLVCLDRVNFLNAFPQSYYHNIIETNHSIIQVHFLKIIPLPLPSI